MRVGGRDWEAETGRQKQTGRQGGSQRGRERGGGRKRDRERVREGHGGTWRDSDGQVETVRDKVGQRDMGNPLSGYKGVSNSSSDT